MPSAYSDSPSPSPSPSVSPSSSATSANSPSAATSLAASVGIGSAPSFRGVRKRSWGKWVAEIREPRKRSRIWLGSYFSAQAAARAFDVAAYCLRGPAARMNLPDTLPSAVKDLPPLSPKSVQRVALAAGSTADSCVREMGPTSRYLSSAPASSGHNDTLRASTSLEVLAPSSFPGSAAGASKSETDEVRTAACNLDVRYNAHSQDFQLKSEVAPQIGSVAKPSFYSHLSGRRAEPFPKPPRLTIADGVEQRNSKGGAIGFITSDAWQSTSTNARPKICWRDQSTTAAAAAKGGGSPKTLWQANHAGDLSSSLLETGAGFSWLDRAKLEISPKPTIEQIAHAMLLVPPAPPTNSQEQQQQQQLQSGSAAGCVAHQQLLQTDSCGECLCDVNDDEHMSEESLWNLF